MSHAGYLPRSAPQAQGVSSAAIQGFLDAAERDVHHLHSVMLLRHGHVIAEGWWDPYGPRYPHMLFSLSKSFTSTAIGMLTAEGKLSVDDPVLGFFPDEAPAAPSGRLRAMRVRHLLSMSTGHAEEPLRGSGGRQGVVNWARAFLEHPIEHEPGAHFLYNSAATYMLSAIVTRLTGTRMLDYLQPRLFEPLGIADPTWETSPQGIDTGGWGLSVTTEDVARFGQLYLQRGAWNGERLVQEAWVDQATSRQIGNGPSPNPDWEQGYGYQFWRCRHDAYRGDGAFGQFCVVMPAQDAVVAITSGVQNLQRGLDLVWRHLLPAMRDAPLPDDRAAAEALAGRMGRLRLPPPAGRSTADVATRVSGQTFAVGPNDDAIDSVSFAFSDEGSAITFRGERGEQRIACGYGRWERSTAPLERTGERNVAAAGAWADEQTYVARLWWYETPFGRTLTCRFDGDRVEIDQAMHVSFGPTERARLEGRRA